MTSYNQQPNLFELKCIITSLLLTLLLHIEHLPIWVTGLFILMACWRYLIAFKKWKLPTKWLMVPIIALIIIGIFMQYHGLLGRDASIALLVTMVGLKLMEMRSQRDYILIIFAGLFLTISTFLFSQSIIIGVLMLLPTMSLLTTWVSVSVPKMGDIDSSKIRFNVQYAGKLLLQALPVMLILFVLFPRIPGPLWGIPQDADKGMTGLSDTMEPGQISDLISNGEIAFRVKFNESIPPKNGLYWRGPVLWHFDGRRWSKLDEANYPTESIKVIGQPIQYTVTLEPSNRNNLMLLEIPGSLPTENGTIKDLNVSHDIQIIKTEPIRSRLRYEAKSYSQFNLGVNLSAQMQTLALQLPNYGNPRSRILAQQWQAEFKTSEAIANQALRYFNREKFSYTLSPPKLGINPVDTFLFNTRRGFCEHYASSFVFLMRAAGVPSRVVTGYQGGEINTVGNYLTIRQSDAHAWAEIWLKDRGWIRLDPTAAVSPERIESGIGNALADDSLLPMMTRSDFRWLSQLIQNWDAVNNGWNQWVLGFDQDKQLQFFSQLLGKQVDWQDLLKYLVICLSIAGLFVGYILFRVTYKPVSAVQQYYAEFLKTCLRYNLQPKANEGAVDFGERAKRALPNKATIIEKIIIAYTAYRYGNQINQMQLDTLKSAIKAFKKSK